MLIEDGIGKGPSAAVTRENRLCVDSVEIPRDQHINTAHQKSFALPFDAIDPVGADDYFFYIKNTGILDLHITDIRMRSTVPGVVEVHGVTGTATFTAGTDVAPVNKTIGNSNSITAIIKTDTDTTGLTSSGIVYYLKLENDVSGQDAHLKSTSHIIIPPGQLAALLWDTATGALSGTISLFEDQAS